MAPLDYLAEQAALFTTHGHRKVSPHLVPNILPNMAAGYVSIEHGLRGPMLSPSTACATGLHSIGEAFCVIQRGNADVMLAGASEAAVNAFTLAGFSQARALSNEPNPMKASRPFDKERSGFVMGEGAGILVLEREDLALKRGAVPLARILGYGCSADAYHITACHPEGDGAQRAMQAALLDAEIDSEQVDMVNAHATGTPLGDLAELKGITSLFKDRTRQLYVSANKGTMGHLLGAAGAAETIFTILTLLNQTLPPNLNCDPDFNKDYLDFLPKGKNAQLRYALKNSFGFGGTNASLLLQHYNI